MAPSVAAPHHHRSTTKQSHKPFKSKHASKGALKDQNKGKVEREERGSRKTPSQQLQSKLSRRNQAKQKQRLKHKEKNEAVSIFAGQNGAARQVAVIPLSKSVDTRAAVKSLNESLDIADVEYDKTCRVRVDRFKQNVMYIPVDGMDLPAAMDAARVADFVVFVMPADDTELDEHTQLLLRSVEGQGISNVLATVQGLDKIEAPKKRNQMSALLKSYIIYFFPSLEKVLSLDSRQECANIVRSLCTATPKGVHWRDDRSWMVIENVQWSEESTTTEHGSVTNPTITGVVRGKGLKADRLVHIPGWGDFQVSSITAAPLPSQKKQRKNEDAMNVDESEGPQVLDEPTADADDLDAVAPEDIVMDDEDMADEDEMEAGMPKEKKGVLLDDHHYFSEDPEDEQIKPRKLPKGTSTYQSAWYLDDVSDSDSDAVDDAHDEDEEMELDDTDMGGPEDGNFDLERKTSMTEAGQTTGPSEYPQSEYFNDRSLDEEAEELAQYRASRKTEAEEDLEFPDEIELHPNVLARERLQRYRGLRSLKTSTWNTEEDKPYEPEDWRRLLQVVDYKGSRNACIREALVGGVNVGLRVNVHLKDVPVEVKSRPQPLSMFSLLRHEHKQSVCNINMTLNTSYGAPLKSKEEVVMQIGPRRLIVNPVYSAPGNTPNDVHKFDRFLHPGRSAVASFIGPIFWGSLPVLVFKQSTPSNEASEGDAMETDATTDATSKTFELIASGTTLPPSHSRVIAKRVILTGHPFKINKRVVTVRYMFFNAEDVNWFKALQLWTKRGRTGYIKESLGTHGYFKATFDAKINAQDVVGISLYKRVFPRKAREWVP